MPLSTHVYNIGSEEEPVLINLKKVALWRKLPRQDGWELFGELNPTEKDIPLRITDEQYARIEAMLLEKEMQEEREEITRPTVERMDIIKRMLTE